MPQLGRVADKIRSKNAGPFWITIDIFCGENFEFIRKRLDTSLICTRLQCAEDAVKRFEIDNLKVIKISIIRGNPQGSSKDRDMHGAQLAVLVAEMDI